MPEISEAQTRELWNEFKRNNIGIIRIPGSNSSKEAIVNEIIIEKFPELKSINTQIQEA